MAFLEIGGVPVPCTIGPQAQATPREIGDRLTSFSGRTRSTVRGHIRTWSLVTAPLPLAEARGLELALRSPYPLTCSGDLIGGTALCHAQLGGVRHRKYADGERAVIEFTLSDAEPYNPVLFWLRAGRPLPAGTEFTRDSPATYIDRSGIFRTAGPDVPRTTWLPGNSDVERDPYLLVEAISATNVLSDSTRLAASGTAWYRSAGLTVTEAASIFAGQTAWRHDDDGTASGQNRNQSQGTLTAGPETLWMIIEDVGAATTGWGIYDATAGDFVARAKFVWSTGEAQVATSTMGSEANVHAELLAVAGPNGGRLWLVAVTATARHPGNARAAYVYPTDNLVAAGSIIIHHVQHEESGRISYPIITGSASGATRAAELVYAAWPHAPQPVTRYTRFVALMDRDGGVSGSPRVLHLGGLHSSDPRWDLRLLSNEVRSLHGNGIHPSVVESSIVADITRGQVVEVLERMFQDGSVQCSVSIDGGPVAVGPRTSAPTGGLPPAWAGQALVLGQFGTGTSNNGDFAYRDILGIRGSHWTLDAVRRLVG